MPRCTNLSSIMPRCQCKFQGFGILNNCCHQRPFNKQMSTQNQPRITAAWVANLSSCFLRTIWEKDSEDRKTHQKNAQRKVYAKSKKSTILFVGYVESRKSTYSLYIYIYCNVCTICTNIHTIQIESSQTHAKTSILSNYFHQTHQNLPFFWFPPGFAL